MFVPLLTKPEQSSNFNIFCILSLLLLSSIPFTFIFKNIASKLSIEDAVGGRLDWNEMLPSYFELATLMKVMEQDMPYAGPASPHVPVKYCDPKYVTKRTPCREVCEKRNKQVDGHDTYVPFDEERFCFTIDPFSKDVICWDTFKMRCWNQRGGNEVWDGQFEWVLLRHFQLEKASGPSEASAAPQMVPYLHFRSLQRRIDFFIFGWTYLDFQTHTRRMSDICRHLEKQFEIMQSIYAIPPDNAVVFAGHLEGSGWALCAEQYMARMKMPQDRRVLTSSTYLDDRNVRFKRNGLHMLLASKLADGHEDKVVGDVIPFTKSLGGGISLPMFGYSCLVSDVGKMQSCVRPTPEVDLQESLKQYAFSRYPEKIFREMHYFKSYYECFQLCYGEDIQSVKFEPNIPSFKKQGKDLFDLRHLIIGKDYEEDTDNTQPGSKGSSSDDKWPKGQMLESPGQKKGKGNQSPGPRGSPNPRARPSPNTGGKSGTNTAAKSSSTPGSKSSATPGSKPSPNPRSRQTPEQRPKTPTTPTKGSNSAGKRPQSNPGSQTPNRTPPLGPQGRQGIQKQQGSGKKSAQPKPDERTRLDDEIRDYMAAGQEQAARRSSSSSGKEKVDEGGEVFPKGDKSARLEEPAVVPPKPDDGTRLDSEEVIH